MYSKIQAKKLLNHYVNLFLLKKLPTKTDISDIDVYEIPGDKSSKIFILNLISENCLDEESKLEIESEIKTLFEKVKPVIYVQAPYSSGINDIVMVNFDC